MISVRVEDTGLLLSGDISSQVENRLVAAGLKPHTALLVPHHGSGTSSSELFLDQVTPDIAIVTAGIGNRFGFPREHIRRRYQDSGVKFWETGGCGAIRMALLPGGKVHAVSARRQRLHLWRWPAAENCP